ncbi:MAG: hypothetical protein M3Z37_10105, partial [Candidatus Eremiobacteraeota bacterium]|nr:hypothetical protein [Candidatus Eremiobacteraeota bacterium]
MMGQCFRIFLFVVLVPGLASCGSTRAAVQNVIEIRGPQPRAGESYRRPPSALLATYVPAEGRELEISAFDFGTAQNENNQRAWNRANPQAHRLVYISAERFDPKYRPPNVNSFLPWMEYHEQDFEHNGDPGMLTGTPQDGACLWTWLADARGPSSYRVYDGAGRFLAAVAPGSPLSFLQKGADGATLDVRVNSVLEGKEVWYTSIHNANGSRSSASCTPGSSHPVLSQPRFDLRPNPHPVYPAPTPSPGTSVEVSGSVVESGDDAAPRLEWLYHPSPASTPEQVTLVGGPPVWRVPDGVSIASDNARWFGSPGLRYCVGADNCTDWWTSGENNRESFSKYDYHMDFLNTCSAQENQDAVRMMKHIVGATNARGFELDDIIDDMRRAYPDLFHSQDPQIWTDAQLYRCDSVQLPRYAHKAMSAIGVTTLLNGGPKNSDFDADGQMFESIGWNSLTGGPYPATRAQWIGEFDAVLGDVARGLFVWFQPTGVDRTSPTANRGRLFSFAAYELINAYPLSAGPGHVFYGTG